MYTATSPIGMLRLLSTSAVTGWPKGGRCKKHMVNDVARAYFIPPSLAPKFVDVCGEDIGPHDERQARRDDGGRCMAQGQQCSIVSVVTWSSSDATALQPRVYGRAIFDVQRQTDAIVYGDDGAPTGDSGEPPWCHSVPELKFERTAEESVEQVMVLSSIAGAHEADARHAEMIVKGSPARRN